MQFLENIDIKSQKDVVAHLGAQAARRLASIDDAANVSPTSKTLVHSLRVSHGVRSLTCYWQLTNGRVPLSRPRAPHEARARHFLFQNAPTILWSKRSSVNDGRASDDGNVKTLTVSIDDTEQLPTESSIRPDSVVHRVYKHSPRRRRSPRSIN